MDEVERILREQDGVISRRQALGAGLTTSDIARLIRRREWVTLHPGVYVDHTGPPTWLQRAWAAVCFSWPAVLSHDSALRAADGPGRRDRDDSVIHVAVDRHRHLVAPSGVKVHRMSSLAETARWNLGPPRVRYEDAVLDVAADAETEVEAVAALTSACGSRRTTPARLVDALAQRSRIARRDWLTSVLRDLAEGTCSVLEHGYLTRVERPHGLPRGVRQRRARLGGTTLYRDVEYGELGLVVELDGRLFHDSPAARDRDLERDLVSAVDGRQTVRLSYGQVFGRACSTAAAIGALLRARGWRGEVRPCPRCGCS